ncbi:MAG TPA: hypothetical protein VGZ73_12190 [Bryobacteraceae bacterium]|nr:hypothetical protein [Bryobacteraceae bacterium]
MRKPTACLALVGPVMFLDAPVGLAERQESKPPAQSLVFEVASVRPSGGGVSIGHRREFSSVICNLVD